MSVPRGWRTTTSRRFRRVWSAHPSRSVLHMCAYAHRHATAPRTEKGIPKFCCCCETHKRAHSPNPQARGPLSQCDGVFSICDENGRVSIATRMRVSMDALSPFTGSGTLVSDDPAVLNLYFPCLFTRLLLPHVHQEGTVHCPCAPRAPGAWRCWRTWSDMAAL